MADIEEGVELTPDQEATREELEARFAEADTLYNVTSVEMQKENAAEVAKAKEAARLALIEERKVYEVERGYALEEITWAQKELVEEK